MTAAPATTGPDLVRVRRSEAPSAAARELLERAARHDAEMGFGPPRPGRRSGPVTVLEIDTCLHRHDVDHDHGYVLAGVLTIRDIGDGAGVADLVVDPSRRAIGVATAVLEEIGTDAGWAGTGLHTLHAVAHGSHPAAERLARRSGVGTAAVRHHLVLPADEPTPTGCEAPSVVRDGSDRTGDTPDAVRLAVAAGAARVRHAGEDERAEIGTVAVAPGTAEHERAAALASVVGSAVGWLRDAGADAVEVVADDDEALLEALRRHLFEHDRSDLVFRISRDERIDDKVRLL